MTQASFAKRRANPRFSFFAEAEVILQDGTSVLGQISELSSRGCYIDMLQPIPIGRNCACASPMARAAANCPAK